MNAAALLEALQRQKSGPELHQFDSLMREAIGERAEGISDEAEGSGPNGQFDSEGLPIGPNHRAHRTTGTELPVLGAPLPLEA